MAIGFTGTRHVTHDDESRIRINLLGLEDTTFVTGGCVGADAVIARRGMELGYHVHVVLPFNRDQVDPAWEDTCHSVEYMPDGTDYRARNQRIVALSERLIAFPEYPEAHGKSRRSGTWMTVRLARKAGIPVEIHILRDE